MLPPYNLHVPLLLHFLTVCQATTKRLPTNGSKLNGNHVQPFPHNKINFDFPTALIYVFRMTPIIHSNVFPEQHLRGAIQK
jgi:hypothetical protein